jgi:hypothetical protein
MSDQPDEEMTADEFFGVEQTDSARMEVKISYSALYQGRPYYPEVRYGDGPRIADIAAGEDQITIVVESESDLRDRVITTAMQMMREWEAAFLSSLTNKKETK